MKSLSRVQLLATPWTAAYQAALSVGFSRQKYWSQVPLPWPSTSLSSLGKLPLPQCTSLFLALHLSLFIDSTFPWIWVKYPVGFASPNSSKTVQSGLGSPLGISPPVKVSDISFILPNIQQELLCLSSLSSQIFPSVLKEIFFLTRLSICKLPFCYNQFLFFFLTLPNSSSLSWAQNKQTNKNLKTLNTS